MTTQTRISIIREAIEAEGGTAPMKCGLDYFCDGPHSGTAWFHSKLHRDRNEATYKVDNSFDKLTREKREKVVDALRDHPDVKDAYLSRKYRQIEGHIKVVFQN